MERGRSLSELGYSLRWTDIRALIKTLPAGSHFRREINPQAALAAEWSTPQVQLLGALYEQQIDHLFLQAGQEPPQRVSFINSRLMAAADALVGDDVADVVQQPEKREASPDEIRARVNELATRRQQKT